MSARGFTLIELLVSMAIFAVISALTLGGLNAVLKQQAIANDSMEELVRLQRTIRWLETDFEGGRHARRVGQIEEDERTHNHAAPTTTA